MKQNPTSGGNKSETEFVENAALQVLAKDAATHLITTYQTVLSWKLKGGLPPAIERYFSELERITRDLISESYLIRITRSLKTPTPDTPSGPENTDSNIV